MFWNESITVHVINELYPWIYSCDIVPKSQ